MLNPHVGIPPSKKPPKIPLEASFFLHEALPSRLSLFSKASPQNPSPPHPPRTPSSPSDDIHGKTHQSGGYKQKDLLNST